MGIKRRRAHQPRRPAIVLGLVAALVLSGVASAATDSAARRVAAHAAVTSTPTLGLASADRVGSGFGRVRPRAVGYGGDPTSFVGNLRWRTWGGTRAVATGQADWVWPGWCVACGSVVVPATVVAFGRTTCGGHPAYSRVEWYFPSRGMTFDRRLAFVDICTGSVLPTPTPRQARCGHVAVGPPGSAIASAITLYAPSISCAAARRFVASSGVARYLHRNARLHRGGWWCGSELSMDLGGPQRFICARGDFTNLSFDLKPRS